MSNAAASVDAETSPGCGSTTALLYRSAHEHPSLLSLDRQLVQHVNVRLEVAEEMAGKLLSGYRTHLMALADRVAERKVLVGDEVRALISAGMTAASEDPKSLAPRNRDSQSCCRVARSNSDDSDLSPTIRNPTRALPIHDGVIHNSATAIPA